MCPDSRRQSPSQLCINPAVEADSAQACLQSGEIASKSLVMDQKWKMSSDVVFWRQDHFLHPARR